MERELQIQMQHRPTRSTLRQPSPPRPAVRDLGRLAYAEALALQRELNQALIDGADQAEPVILLVEHPAVITLPHRPSAKEHLLVSPYQRHRLGIDLQDTDRGGDITYHGPGQLVVYPILNLRDYGLNLSCYMRLLELVVIDTLDQLGVTATREDGHTGVWVDLGQGQPDKICAMGVRVRKHTTLHGLALNVHCDLSHFQTIVPCGLHRRGVTSLARLLGEHGPSMDRVKAVLSERLIQGLMHREVGACSLPIALDGEVTAPVARPSPEG